MPDLRLLVQSELQANKEHSHKEDKKGPLWQP